MSKRWDALPPGGRWLAGGIAAVVLTAVAAWVLFVPAADWLARHDVGSVVGSVHETALDNARGRLLALGAGLFAAGALVFTARNFTLSREGQVTDRYTKAIEQLGSGQLAVRIGGIYALERVARDSAKDHPTVMEVLAAFIREPPYPVSQVRGGADGGLMRLWPDVQAALTVIGRRDTTRDVRLIDLSDADLARAYLREANLHAALPRANLTGANLADADLADAKLTEADLTGARLTDANLTGADLADANLFGADLTGANLADANLFGANLTGANLTGANLADANLFGADLTGADLADANLRGAWWPVDTPVPEGWELDTLSGRLVEAGPGTDSGPAEAN
jgi:hypothetical protein